MLKINIAIFELVFIYNNTIHVKKIIFSFLFFFSFIFIVKSQPINVSNITTTGRFNTCNAAPPTVTVTFISSNGSTVINGKLICLNPDSSTIVEVRIINARWNKGADISWIHGFFLSNNPNINVVNVSLSPSNWVLSSGCTGACPSGGLVVGGAGFYFIGSGQSCCPGGGSTPSPCDNYGDPLYDCGTPFSLIYRLKIKNSYIANNFAITMKGTSDGSTGCWLYGDVISNTISFQLEGNPCSTGLILCNPIGSSTIYSGLAGPYQWQNSTDSVQFNNITDNANYSGTNSAALGLINISSTRYGEQFRCIANGIIGDPFTLKFNNTWTGAINTDWNNVGNWSCGTLPDQYTDVIINFGTVIVSANTTIRSLNIQPTASVTTNTGVVLTILH